MLQSSTCHDLVKSVLVAGNRGCRDLQNQVTDGELGGSLIQEVILLTCKHIHLSVHPSVNPSIHLSIYLSFTNADT